MSGNSASAEIQVDESCHSKFTYRDLRQLAQSSTTSALRVIALVDFDCFYAQCESVRLGLSPLRPLGVQQFKHVIAVNYPARAVGLPKVLTAIEAKRRCPDIVLQHVPTWREGDGTWRYRDDALQNMSTDKSSLDYYRLQSRKAMKIVRDAVGGGKRQKVEKAGIDEVFIDLSAQIYVVLTERYPELCHLETESLDCHLRRPDFQTLDWQDDQLVQSDSDEDGLEPLDWDTIAHHIGSEMVRRLRREIYQQLRYTCSAGIARNKILAKLAAGHNKPDKQTVVRICSIPSFLSTYKFTKLRGLGGKLGRKAARDFDTEMIRDLLQFPLAEMQSKLGHEAGLWVFRVIRGSDNSDVSDRTQIQSMLSEKTFTPSILSLDQAERWLRIFAADIEGRLADEEGRRPRTLAVHHHVNGRFGPTRSKQTPIPPGARIDTECLVTLSRDLLVQISREGLSWPCLCLSVSVSDFVDSGGSSHSITTFLKPSKYPLDDESVADGTDNILSSEQSTGTPKRRRGLDSWAAPVSVSDQTPSGMWKPDSGPEHKRMRMQEELDSEASTPDAIRTDEGWYRCPTCTESIPAVNVLEHLDWHVAIDLRDRS